MAGGDDDKTFVVLDGSGDDGGYVSSYTIYYTPPPPLRLRAHIFTERDPYRPGETVHITGWLRSETAGPMGKLGMLLYDRAELEWESAIHKAKVWPGKTSLDKKRRLRRGTTRATIRRHAGAIRFHWHGARHRRHRTPTVGRALFRLGPTRTPVHVVWT